LFYAAGCVYQIKHVVDIERLGGLFRLMPVTAVCFIIGGAAISALPPFNGFASEFLIYSGLFTSDNINVWAKLMLSLTAAALAFVGAVSALSMTRAFGVIFLGSARDASLPAAHEASAWMLAPMALHAGGSVLLGVAPTLGFALVAAPTALFLHATPDALTAEALQSVTATLAHVGALTATLVAAVLAVVALRAFLSRQPARRNATWSCGYEAPHARMQYTGSSFSSDFTRRFSDIVVVLKRQKAPLGYFPNDSYVITDCVDAVERRLFAVIGQGNDSASQLSQQLREDDPRLAFSAALAALVAIAALVALAEGAMP
jgi:hydrogenase-4 component B